jgi:hypothetical protein
MTTGFRLHRGLEVYPRVDPHRATAPRCGHSYDEGFDAAVRIQVPESTGAMPRSRVFRVAADMPFQKMPATRSVHRRLRGTPD